MMRCSLYIRSGVAYIPVDAKTEAGFHMNIEPVEVVPVSDSQAFARAIKQTIARGNPMIPTPTRATGFPKPVIPKYAKLKSWRAFEQDASYWTFEKREGAYEIEQWQKSPERGWDPDPERRITLPDGTPQDEAIKQLVTIVQSQEK
jgi:hypothetical protein